MFSNVQLILLLGLTFSPASSLLKRSTPQFSFDILHFNDAYDIQKSSQFAQKWTELKTEKTLGLFSGDIYSPSVFSQFKKGRQFTQLLKLLALDAAVVGNHEFDYGEEEFLALKQLNPELTWLNANLYHQNSESRVGGLEATKVLEVDGIKVGVFGLVDEDWLLASNIKPDQVVLREPVEVARELSAELKKKMGCELVIALTHMTNADDLQLLMDKENSIDFILGGHDHIFYVQRVNNRVLLKSGYDFGMFSRVAVSTSTEPLASAIKDSEYEFLLEDSNRDQQFFEFSLPRKNGKHFLNLRIERVTLQPDGPSHPVIDDYLLREIKPITDRLKRPVYYLETDLEARSEIIRQHESAVCNFVADLIRIDTGADLAMVTSGGFRLESHLPRGSILRYQDIKKLLPFQDDIEIISLSGDDVIEFLEEGIEAMLEHRPAWSVSGVVADYDPSHRFGHRVRGSSVLINNHPIDSTRMYKIAVPSYIAQGKDGFRVFEGSSRTREVLKDTDLISVLEKSWSIPSNSAEYQEFLAFKKEFPGANLNNLGVVAQDTGVTKAYYTLDPLIIGAHGVQDTLPRMAPTAMKRLMTYSLFSGVKEVEGSRIFSVSFAEGEPRIRAIVPEGL